MTHDVVTFGEGLIRYSVPPGQRLEDARRLDIFVGGAELNVAVALARMGLRPMWISRLPANPLGTRIARRLAAAGVSTAGISWAPDSRIGTYYVELGAEPRGIEAWYDRGGSAFSTMAADDIPWAEIEGASLLHVTGINLALSDSCKALTVKVMKRATDAGTLTVFDVNYRAKLWASEEAAPALAGAARSADVVIITEEDAFTLFGLKGEPSVLLSDLSELLESETLILTQGDRGVAWVHRGMVEETSAIAATVVDRIGAGDAFAAGVILGVLDEDLAVGIRLGTAMAALTLGVEGDQFRFGPKDVESVLESRDRQIRR